jgi:succinate dehydrogenase / fumarate reductase cytochrome b subunit
LAVATHENRFKIKTEYSDMQKERPLSPHLQIYRPTLNMVLSVFHRGTGSVLALSTPLLVYWLMTLAAGPEAYIELQECLSHWFFKVVLLGYVFSMSYHLCNGVRHLFWDVGQGYSNEQVQRSGMIAIIVSVVLTAAIFLLALSNGGAS